MTELLKRVVAQVEELPAEQQDAIAELLQQELEEREWEAIVAKPGSQSFLAQLATEARRERARGQLRDLEDCW